MNHVADHVNRLVSLYKKDRQNRGRRKRFRIGESLLETLLRKDMRCASCSRRKRIGLVFCWTCWDEGCSSPEKYFRAPFQFSGLSVSSWLGIFSVHTVEDEARGRSRDIKNMIVAEDELENPALNPVSAPTTVVLTNGQTRKPILPQVKYTHSNMCAPGVGSPKKKHDYRIRQRDVRPLLSFAEALKLHSSQMTLLTSAQHESHERTLQRMWSIIIPVMARIKFLKERTPTIVRNEYLVKRSLKRMQMRLQGAVFNKLTLIVEHNKLKRSQDLQASRMARRIFFRVQAQSFETWHEHAHKQARAKAFLKRHLGGLLHMVYDIWKEKWLVGHRAREREAKARAFIRRYQMQTCVKCLYALKQHADLQIRLRSFIQKWRLQPAKKMIEPWLDLVYRNKRVRAFIKRHLAGIQFYCFDFWKTEVRDILNDRQRILRGVVYRFKRKRVSAAFNTIVFFRRVSVATRNLQRVYQGFLGRKKARAARKIADEVEKKRVVSEKEHIEAVVSKLPGLFAGFTPKQHWKLLKRTVRDIEARIELERGPDYTSIDAVIKHAAKMAEAFDKADHFKTGFIDIERLPRYIKFLAHDTVRSHHALKDIVAHFEQGLMLITERSRFEDAERKIREEWEMVKRANRSKEQKEKQAQALILSKAAARKKLEDDKYREEEDTVLEKAEEVAAAESEEDAARDSDNEEAIATGLTREERKNKRREKLEAARKSIKDARQARKDAAKKTRQKALKEAEEKAFQRAELQAAEEEELKKRDEERAAGFEQERTPEMVAEFWAAEKKLQRALMLRFAEDERIGKLTAPSLLKRWKTKVLLALKPMERSIVKQMEEVMQFYLREKAVAVAREHYRYLFEKPREICPTCRQGFRFISELIAHTRSEPACEKYTPPSYWKDKGTFMFQATIAMTESAPEFPMLDEEVASYPKIVTTKQAAGEPTAYFQYFFGRDCIDDQLPMRQILARDIVRVISVDKTTSVDRETVLTGHEHNFWKREVLQITAKETIKFQTRRGLKKRIRKVYFKIALHSAEEHQKWHSKLLSIARQNRRRRRQRRDARIERREALRLQVREVRELKKKARKEMLADAIALSKQKAREDAMRRKALRKARREEIRKRREAAGRKAVEEQIAMQRAEHFGEHLVEEAENFLSELKEAKAAVSAAQYGMFEEDSLDEVDMSAEEHWGDDSGDDDSEDEV